VTATLTIDLDAIAANWRILDAQHPRMTAAVVKANAYGLGAEKIVPKLAAAGCRHFFTAHLEEAIKIRPLIPRAMLAVLNGLYPNSPAEFSAHNIIPVLGSLPEIAPWRAEAARLGRPLPVILHFDTGMSRLGLTAQDAEALDTTGLTLEFIMTHLVSADSPNDPRNAAQAAAFRAIARHFPKTRTSLANSSGIFLGSLAHSTLARPGAALYGINPTPHLPNPMRGTIHLSAPILKVQHLNQGDTVGYNATWTAQRPSRIAVLGVGYADGYHRILSNAGTAIFDGAPVPLVGRVSMDLTTFDITDTHAEQGDAIELLGPHHGPDDLAREAGTNGYEILTALGNRYQRHYIGA
jgi:alanine racemase